MATCTGDAGGTGRHCCWIGGQQCRFLITDEQRVWCGLLIDLGTWDAVHRNRRWKTSRVGRWFKTNYPGFGCGDWPQNIPEAVNSPSGKCCWQGDG